MRQYLRINLTLQRFQTCVVFLIALNCVMSEDQQETHPPESFSTLLQILDDDVVRERRDVSEDFLAAEGSTPENGEGSPVIVLSNQTKFVLKTPGKLSVDVGSTVYAVKGAQITVSCRASAPTDTPKIEWLRNGYPVTDRFMGDVAAIDGVLRIRRLGRFNEGTYACRASNDAGDKEALFTAKIIIPSLPTILKVEGDFTFGPNDKVTEITIGSTATVYRGATLTIRCPVEGIGNPVVFWTSRGRSVNIGKATKVGNDLVITDIDKRYALTYKCTARTNRGKVDADSTVHVKALDPPRIKQGTRVLRIVDEESKEVEIYVGTKLTVISETQVTIRCEASMDPAPAISWEIRGKNSDFKEIVSLSEDNSTLTLSDPGVEDSGMYTCIASNNVGQDSKSSKIEILPPEPPRIFYSNQKVTQLKKREVLEAKIGDQLTLLAGVKVIITCLTSGLPTPTVKWKKDNEDLSVTGDTLEIKNATTQDTGVYTCEAVNRAGRFSYSSQFQVIACEKPEIESSTGRVIGLQGVEEAVVKIGQDLRVVEGLIVHLVCPVSSGFPTPQVTWFLNDRMVKSSERFLIDSRSNSLIINGIHLQDTGQVSCVANNCAGQATESSFVSILGESSAQILFGNSSVESIKGTEKVDIQIGDSLYILSGSDVSIDCIARGTPPPVINWRWDGREVISGARRGQLLIADLSEGSRLSVQKFTTENAGQYECVATNTGGADRIASSITVLEATFPKIEVASSSVEHITNLNPVSVQIGTRVTLLPGVRLEITCRASGIPEPTISWFREGKEITSSGRFSINDGDLVIRATELSDRGSFTCAANNTLGRTAFSTKVDIIEPIKPRIMQTGRDLTLERITRLSEAVGGSILCRDGIDLELTCTVQGTPTPKIVWLRGGKTVGTGSKLNLGILKEESSGNYTCVATNVGGEDRKTTKLNVKSAIPPVIESSDKVVESLEEGKSLVVDIGTRLRVVEGTSIDLICPVSGFPTPKVDWVKGNEPLDQRFERQGFFVYPFNGTSSTLLIRGTQRAAEDEVYGCTAYNGGGSVTAFSYVTIKERIPPKIFSTWVTGSVGSKVSLESRDPVKVTIGDGVRVFTKTQVTIECPWTAIPLAKIQWTHNGGLVQSKHQTLQSKGQRDFLYDSALVLEDSDTSHSGRYTCAATNPLGRDAAWSTVAFIEPTLPTVTMGESSLQLLTAVEYTATIGNNITTLVGSNLTFVCASEGRPAPSMFWRKDDVDLNATGTLYTMYAFDTNATGVYSCVAENLAGFFVAKSTVTILDRAIETATVPRIITSRTNQVSTDDRRIVEHTIGGNVSIIEGRDLLLKCPVEGVPLPSTAWLFSGLPVEASDTLLIDEAVGNLRIIEMTPDDVGMYACVATNIAGETREFSYVTVIEPTFPVIDSSNISIQVFDPTRKPLQVKVGSHVTTLTGTPVAITCDVTGFPEPKVSWVKGRTAITGSDAERLLMSKSRISLLKGERSDSGLYMCTASGPGGQAAAVSNITFVEPVKPRILLARKEQEILRRLSVNITVGEKLTILDKSNVTVECKAKGIPTPSLSWSKDGARLQNSAVNLLHLKSVTLEDAGRYTCTADNFLGSDSQSAVLSVRVGKRPLIKSKKQEILVDDVTAINLDIGSNLTLVAGSSVNVICEVDAVPEAAITWQQNGDQVFNSLNKTSLIVEDPGQVKLQTVSCKADNVLGFDSKASYFKILEPSKPVVKLSEEPKAIEAQDRSPITLTIGDNVTALTNINITIQCPTSGIPTPTVAWTKDGQKIPSGGRYTVQDDGSLLISEAGEEDNARYTCTADSVAGKDSASSMVQVVEPSRPVIEVPEPGREIPIGDGSPVTMNIGDNVTAASNTTITIRCPISGVPTPSVTWFKDAVSVQDDEKDEKLSITDDNFLVIRESKVEAHSAKFTCSAQNAFGVDKTSSIVIIIVPFKPVIDILDNPKSLVAQDQSPMTLTIGDNVTALTNTSITIQCPTSGVPTPTVTWTKDGQEIPSGGRYTVQDDGSLLISGPNEDDNARYTCTADSVAGKDSASSMVQIVEPVKPLIEVPESGREIPVGDGSPVTMNIGDNVTAASNTTITIRCPVSGVPTPSVTWEKDGVQLLDGEESSITDDKSLMIRRAEVPDSAKYTCSVQNSFGKDASSAVVRIIEPSKPVVKISDDPKTIEAQDGSPITLTIGDNVTALTNTSITIQCPTSGVPTPTVTWTKGGQEIPSGGRYTVQDDDSLLISEADEDDNARYTCTADSVAGKDSASSMVHIVEPVKPVIEVPEPGREIPIGDGSPVIMNIGDNVTAASNTTITIRCPVSGVPTPSVTWMKDGELLVDGEKLSVTDDNSLVIRGAVNSAKYTCSVQSVSGTSSLSSIVKVVGPTKPVVKTSPKPRTIKAQDRSPITLTIGDNVTALTNTSITIQCPTSGVPTPTVAWTKDGQEIPSGGRYTVQDDGSFVISEADEEDNARYTCTADSVAGKDSASSAVEVVEPVKPSINVPESGRDIPIGNGSPVTMNIGDNVTAASNTTITIRCPVSGVPTPSVTWEENGVPLVDGDKVLITEVNSLVIRGAEKSAKYTCSLQSMAGTSSLSSIVKIVGPTKPVVKTAAKPKMIEAKDQSPITLTIGDNVTALTNTSITIQCPTSGVPTPTVAWTKDGQEIPSGSRYTVQDDGSLLISEADEEDNARYTCSADNVAGKDSASSTVQVVEPAKPVIEVPKSGREIPVGDGSPVTMNIGDNVTAASNTTITIRCPVSGVPTPFVTWTKDGAEITPEEEISFTDDNLIIIKAADVEDSVMYTCTARNEFGRDDTSSIVRIIEPSKPVIDIPEKPKTIEAQDLSPITLTIGDNVTALTNTSITIQCPTSGVPSPTVTWTKDGQEIPSGGRYTVQDDGSLLIREANEEDNARYTCTADSVAGKDSASSTVGVLELAEPVIEVPESGREIPVGDGSPVTMNIGDNVTAASNTTITIRCPVSGIPTPSVTWEKDGTRIIEGDNTFISNDNSLVIKEAKIDDSAKYICSVQSKFGKDDTSSIVKLIEPSKPVVKISDEPKTIEVQDRSPIILTIGDNVTALTNTNITIQCPTSGVPTPTVTWTKDGQEITSGGRYTVQDDGSLLISEADEDDNAGYTCSADSVAGKDSASSTVKVAEPVQPVIEVPESGREIPVGDGSPVTMNIGDNVTAASNTTITIRCPVSGVPTPSVTWEKDGARIVEGNNIFISYDNSLVIEEGKVDDSAKYICSVRSKFGKDDTSSLVKIIEPSKPAIDTPDEPKTIKAQDLSPVTLTIGDTVTALTNTSIAIQCPTSGVPTPTVTWTKDGQEIPSGRGRYTVQDDGSLVISEADEDDNARYTCTADSVAGKDSASSTVEVVEPVKPMIQVPETGREIPVGDGSLVTMNIGDNVTAASNTNITIRCPVSGVPTPSVTWTKDGVEVVGEDEVSITNENALVIQEAQSEDSATYTCKVESEFGKESLSSIVRIKGPSKPMVKTPDESTTIEAQDLSPITLTIGDNVTALTNTSITIQCPTSGVPTPTVTWTKDGQNIPSGGRYTVQDDGSLVIREADEEDNARYTCTADSVAGKDSASSMVQVVEPVKPSIEVPESGREIPVGDGSPVTMNIGDNVTAASNTAITIRCPVSGVPTPSVTWFKDGAQIMEGDQLFFTDNNSLVIDGAEVGDGAKYTCSIQSVFGKDDVSTFIAIIDPVRPQITSSVGEVTSFNQEQVNITIGQNLLTLIDTKLSIKCPANGIPIPKITWTKGNETLPSDGRMTVKNGTLVIVELETSDSGNYTCSSENAAGIASVSSNVTIAVPSPPEIIRTGIKDVEVVEPKSIEAVVGSTILTISNNNVSLVCRVKGFPPPSVQWTKDGVPLKAEGSTLQFSIVDVNDTGVYTCTATSSLLGLTDSTSTRLTVIAVQPPLISTGGAVEVLKVEDVSAAVGGVVTTLDGNRVSLLCEVSGVPDPQITWEREGAEVQRGGTSYTIETAVQSDSGSYSCIASNTAGETKATSQLNILVGSAPKISTSQENLVHMNIDIFEIKIGSNLTTLASSGLEISCPTTGFPKPTIQWYREGVPVQLSLMLNVEEDTGTLYSLSISHRKGGRFTCEASNALGSVRASSFITVLVPAAPQINVSRLAVRSLDNRDPVSIRVGQTLSVLSGTKVTVECPVSGIPKPDVTWSRDDSKLDTDGSLAVKDSVLIINSVTIGDMGVYLCKAGNLLGEVVASSMVNVTETLSPKISAADQSLKILQSGSFTVDVGSNVTTVTRNALSIRCNATGVPSPQITWSKDGSLLEATGPVYILQSLVLSDSGHYQCTASNVDGSDVQDIRIDVLGGSAPKITTPGENVVAVSGENEVTIVIGGNLTTVVGTGVKIYCPVTGLPNATITWLFNGSSVEEGNIRFIDRGNGAFTMIGVGPEDVGFYTCVAKNPFGSVSKTTFLSLIIPVEPKILSSNKDIKDFKSTRHDLVIGDSLETLVGTTVYIRCPATGNPAPLIEWEKSGFPVIETSSLQIVNSTLILLESTWSDTGNYACSASSGAGYDQKTTFLKFMAPEKPSIRGESISVESYDRQPVTVAVGGTLKVLQKTTVNIRCVASGIPEPSVYWNSSSSDMQPANKYDVNQGGWLLTIREVDTTDSGKYMCSAVNKAGEVSQAAVLEVVEASLPIISTSDATVSWYNREPRVLRVGSTIEVLSGTKVTLTCKYSAFPEAEVQWSVLGEEGQTLEQNAGNEVINGSLVLMALQPSDSAKYVCSVRNVAGTASASTTLKVLDPQPPSISSSQGNVVSLSEIVPVKATVGSVLTVLSGTRITITCSADGIPTPTVAWSKGEELIHTSSADNRTIVQSGVLTIDDATTGDSGDYLCTAMSEVGADQESTKVTVIEPSRPIIKQPEVDKIPLSNKTSVAVSVGSDVTVLTQTRVNMTCEAEGVPKPKLTWLRDGQPVRSEVNSSLVLTITTLEDAGQVTCFAENLAGNTTLSTDIGVIEPVLPRIKSGEGEIVALKKRRAVTGSIGVSVQTFTGTSVTLECSAEGSPKPTVSWTKNGKPLESKDRVSIGKDGAMTIRNTRVADSGRYMCSAKSPIGESYEASSIYVRAPIRPRITKSKSYIIWYEKQPFKGKVGDNLTTLKGRKLTLTCPALGLPQPAIAWYRGGMRMKSGGSYVAIGNTLIMYNLNPMDTDRYTCVARNFAGVTSATTTLKVHEPMAPKIMSAYGYEEALQNHNRLNVTVGKDVSILQGSPLTIKCPVLGVPEPKIKWIKDRKMLSSNDRMDMDCAGILNIYKLEPEDSGDYVCTAESFLGLDIAFSAVTVFEAIKPSVEISGRVYTSSGSLVDMHVGDNLTAIVTTPVNINCTAKGIPKPRMRWKMNGQQLGNGGNYKTDNNGALGITRLEDPGEFTCIAENFMGHDDASSFITILEPTKPTIITPENPKEIEPQDRSPITLTIGNNVTALTNTSITIQCPTSGVPTPTVTWTKDGQEIPSGGRYTVQDDGSLLISEAERGDNGRYTCTSGNVAGNSSASSIVQLVDPVKPAIEVPEKGQEIPVGDGSPVTMNIGDNVTEASNTTITIRCPVTGVPTPSVTWKKDGAEITAGMEYSVTRDNSLVIEGATAEDSAKYTCRVKSVSGTDEESSVVKILGPSKPVVKKSDEPKTVEAQDRSPITLTIGDNLTALTNTSITIQCPTSGVPSPTVTWTKDGQQIPSGGRYTVQDDGSLLISETGEEDNARYTCTADNVAGKDSASSTVQVVEPTKPVIEVPEPGREIPVGDGSPVTMNIGDNVTAASNTTITIRCPVSGVPTPSVTWKKDGVEITPAENFVITSEDSLVIAQAEADDSAKYTCTARGLTGSDSVSSMVQIVEPSKPVAKTSDEPKTIEAQDQSPITLTIGDNVTALTNTSITIQCPTSGVPTPTVTWTKDGQEIPSRDRYTVQDDGSLLISEADEEDNARYTCTADNVAGKDSASSMVKINGLKKPTILVHKPGPKVPIGDGRPVVSPVGSDITELAFVKITLTCPTEGTPPPQITWKKDGVELVPGERYVIDNKGSLTIPEAATEDSGNFTCSAQNAAGVEEVTSLIDILEPLEPVILPPTDSITSHDHKNVTAGVGSKISAFKGATVSITCAVRGVPKPEVSWTKDGQSISQGERVVVDSNGTLIIRDTSVEDSGDYSCAANSRAGRASATSPLVVTDTMHPVIVSLNVPVAWYKDDPLTATIGSSVRTLPGTQLSFTCPATGIPSPAISWRKGNEVLLQTGLLLTLGAVDSSNQGQYTCVATNIAGSAEASSDVTLEAPTRPSIERSVEEVSWDSKGPLTVAVGSRVDIINGSTLILKCVSSGVPPAKLTWTRGIDALSEDDKYTIGEQTLTIRNVQYADADEYTCTASNQAGQDAATTELVVKGPGGPIILPDRRIIVDVNSSKPVIAPIGANVTTVVNATVIMTCPSQGSPQPTVTWNHNQRFIVPGGRYFTNESSLVIWGVRLQDAGRYQCTASNNFGRDVESLTLTVTVPPLISNVKGTFEITDIRDLISITTGAVVTIPRGVSVRIKCIATGVPAPTITWYRRRPGMNKRYAVVPSDAVKIMYDYSLSISHAAVNDAAYYICVATNIAGRDEGSTVLNIGTPPEIPSQWRGIKSRFNIPDHVRRSSVGAVATVVKGAILHIKCAVEGTPKPTITWVVSTSSQEQRYSVLDDGTLVLPEADLEDEGNYTCIANNSYGTLHRTTTVSILVPPEILDRHFRHIFNEKRIEGYAMAHAEVKRNTISSLTVERGFNLMLICTVVGKPTPHITWTRNKVLIKNDTKHLLLPNGVLLVRQINIKESGQYKCVASNIAGKDQGSVRLTVKNEATGYWKATAWSQCGNCITHLRGWQQRHISCMSPVGKAVSDLHCIHKHKLTKRRRCTHRDCHVIWRTSAWSACSRSCGSHGIKLRNAHCVFAKSLKPAKGQCGWQKKPSLQEPCNRKSCIKVNCVDKVKYCQRVKQIGMCPVYSRWCCNTCR